MVGLLVTVVILCAVLGVLFDFYVLNNLERRLYDQAEERCAWLAAALVPVLEEGGREEVGAWVRRLLPDSPDVCRIEVTAGPGDSLFAWRLQDEDAAVEVSCAIRSGETVLGRVVYGLSAEPLDRARNFMVRVTVFVALAVALGIGIMAHFLFRRLLDRPLGRLAAGIEDVAQGRYDRPLPLPPQEDLRGIVEQVNALAVQVDGRTRELERHRRELEARVRQRTADLEAAFASLQVSENRFRTLFRSACDAIFLKDCDCRYLQINPAMERLLGQPAAKLVGRTDAEIFGLAVGQGIRRDDERVLQGAVVEEEQVRPILGSETVLHVVKAPLHDGQGAIVGICGIARDITARRQAEQQLREREERYRAIFHNIQDVYFEVDRQGTITELSPSVVQVLGVEREALLGASVATLLGSPEEADALRRQLEETGQLRDHEIRLRDAQGALVPCSLNARWVRAGRKRRVVGNLRDIRARKVAEEALLRVERQAAVGTLAGGVAHEFNNINASILGFAELALERPGLEPTLTEYLERICNSSRRARSITRNLLTFAGTRKSALVAGDLVRVVEDTLLLVGRDMETDGIVVERQLAPVPPTLMDPDQIGQVILNLLINARHAMLDRPEQRLRLETGAAGDWVWLAVSDTGCGIPKAHLSRIFSPFFSTKGEHAERWDEVQSRNKGTGLGLSVSHTILEHHGGELLVESEVGVGSRFTLRLPQAPADANDAAPADSKPSTATSGARLLVLDDDEDSREVLRTVLERLGHAVRVTDNGYEALEVVYRGQVDLVLVDMKMPNMSGLTFLQRRLELARNARPAVLIVTGKMLTDEEADLDRLDVSGLVEKPFSLDAVTAAVEQALRARLLR